VQLNPLELSFPVPPDFNVLKKNTVASGEKPSETTFARMLVVIKDDDLVAGICRPQKEGVIFCMSQFRSRFIARFGVRVALAFNKDGLVSRSKVKSVHLPIRECDLDFRVQLLSKVILEMGLRDCREILPTVSAHSPLPPLAENLGRGY
jgi:hypothetical protein